VWNFEAPDSFVEGIAGESLPNSVMSRIKKHDIATKGRTVLFVSHNMAAIEHLCQRVIVLDSGKVQVDTAPDKAFMEYFEDLSLTAKNYD